MAFDLVGTLISQLTPYVQEEYAIFKDVNKHAEKLSSNLTAIHAVLQDAEEKQITSRAVKDWLQKLTDAAHVLDDILDECSIFSEENRDKHSIIHPKKLYARRSIGKKMKNVAERIDAIAEERVKFGLNPGTMEHRLDNDTGFCLAELHNLQLGGKLHIKGLENVSNETDAREANLIGKKELSQLTLSWGTDANSQVSFTSAEQVLEALEPHTGLKYFGMNGYKGINIPNWMRNTSILECLVEVKLSKCRNFVRLPPLGKLPCLTTLHVSRMRELKYIDDDLYEGATKKAFPSLKKMVLYDLPNLERVLKAEGVEMLSQLSDLHIEGVTKLAFPSLPSVGSFDATGNTESDSIDGGASFLRRIAASMHNLKKFEINYFDELKVLPNELNSLSSLQQLHITGCDKLESIPECVLQGLCSLQVLKFSYCSSLKSLSEATMNKLTFLRELVIKGGYENETLPNGLEGIPSLQILSLSEFPSLVTLPDWLGTMTSLQTLDIYDCPKLSSLPDCFKELTNLHELHIIRCPKLEKRCKKETGEDWHKIAHVPRLDIKSTEPKPLIYEEVKAIWYKSKPFWRSQDLDFDDFVHYVRN
ncbi:hypothetical protein P8452_50911 [Trifolium repens]|nr:hypothetical protein P8452_50911 [Trifolium repens]